MDGIFQKQTGIKPIVRFDSEHIYLDMHDGRTGYLPLKSFPRLYHASEQQKAKYSFSPFGVHWEDIDEDLSYEGFIYIMKNKKSV
jgi:hypothetical protein